MVLATPTYAFERSMPSSLAVEVETDVVTISVAAATARTMTAERKVMEERRVGRKALAVDEDEGLLVVLLFAAGSRYWSPSLLLLLLLF